MEHTYRWALPAETTGGSVLARMKKQKSFEDRRLTNTKTSAKIGTAVSSSSSNHLILSSGAQIADSH